MMELPEDKGDLRTLHTTNQMSVFIYFIPFVPHLHFIMFATQT